MSKYLRRGSALATTIYILFGITAMALIAIEMIDNGIIRRRMEGASGKAIYAAEAGIELALREFNLNNSLFQSCFPGATNNSGYIDFVNGKCSSGKVSSYVDGKSELASYQVEVSNKASEPRWIEINSRGTFQDVSREIYVKFCLPTCVGVTSNGSDGCNGVCP